MLAPYSLPLQLAQNDYRHAIGQGVLGFIVEPTKRNGIPR
jgi:hypothetical protein